MKNLIRILSVVILFILTTTIYGQASLPNNQDFEAGTLGDWKQSSSDGMDWTIHSGKTGSNGTGPAGANGGNFYIYTEATGNYSSTAGLEFKADFSAIADPQISFYYHMYGASMGDLKLQFSLDGKYWITLKTIASGDQGDVWYSKTVDLAVLAGVETYLRLYAELGPSYTSDICLDDIVVCSASDCGGYGPTPCAQTPFTQDFEGSTLMSATTNSQSGAGISAYAYSAGKYGLLMDGGTSTGWSSSYSTGPDAFKNSPTHVSKVSREICSTNDNTITLKFKKRHQWTYNTKYSWFRLTVNGTPVADKNGNIYFSGESNNSCGSWETMEYDLSAYSGANFTVAWEACTKYSNASKSAGCGGDVVHIDEISLVTSNYTPPPSAPVAITGDSYPNETSSQTYTIDPVANATSYTWAVPSDWNITAGQGTKSLTVTVGKQNGNVEVYASNTGGNSSTKSTAVKSANVVSSFPASVDFESEIDHSTTAGDVGFEFVATAWRNKSGDNGDWRAISSGTPSSGTGPSGAGTFLYIESSTPNYPNKTFELWSPPFNLSGLTYPVLTFQYHMYGTDMGALTIQVSKDHGMNWTSDLDFMSSGAVSGDMGKDWRQGVLDLTAYQSEKALVIRFKGVTGSDYTSDICLDDISVSCLGSTPIKVTEDMTLSADHYGTADITLGGINAITLTTNGNAINNLTINGAGGVLLADNTTVNGNLRLSSGELNCQNKDISLKGNFVVTAGATFTPGTNTVTFSGTGVQSVTTKGQNFNNIEINNTNDPIAINVVDGLILGTSGKLKLTDGVIKTVGTTPFAKVVVKNTDPGAIIGADGTPHNLKPKSYVWGNLRRHTKSSGYSGKQKYEFPVGIIPPGGGTTPRYYRARVDFKALQGVSHITTRFIVGKHPSYSSEADFAGAGYSVPETDSTAAFKLAKMLEEGYWRIHPNKQPSSGKYDIVLYTNVFDEMGTSGKLAPIKTDTSNTAVDGWTIAGDLAADNSDYRTTAQCKIKSYNLSSFSDFGFGDGGGSALPIELLSFDVSMNGNKATLVWTTATEINNDYFTIERTADGIAFEEIMEMPGAGNSFTPLTYITTDESPFPGLSYYRLKQTDYDGQFEYSGLVELNNKYIGDVVSYNVTYPDNKNIILTYETSKENVYNLFVYDITGKVVKRDQIETQSGNNRYKLNIRRYQSGTYFITLQNQNEIYSDKFIVK